MRIGPRPPKPPERPLNSVRQQKKARDEAVRTAPQMLDFDSDKIDLHGVAMAGEMCSELCQALRLNETVKELDLSHCNIGDTGAEELCGLLAANPNITTLNLSHNSLTDWGVVCIVRGNKKHSALESLDLSGNNIGDGGLADLGRLLQSSNNIHELVLTDTAITFTGAVAFLEMALTNHSLLYLTLPFTLGYKLMEEAEKLLRRNWARFQQVDKKLHMAELLVQRLDEQEAMRKQQWAVKQAKAEKPMSRTKTVEAPMADWRDREKGSTLMLLSLLDRKSKQVDEEREERRQLTDSHRSSCGLTPRSGRSSVASLPPLPMVSPRNQSVSKFPATNLAPSSARRRV